MNLSVAEKKSAELTQLIQQEIQSSGGFISFARFMELTLYAPDLGYYTGNTTKFGRQGDFVTAPEISPLFAKCLARQCSEIFSTLNPFSMMELGAGTGIFAKDLLQELEKLNALPDRYFIVEPSSDLRERQKKLLQATCPFYFSRIEWRETLPKEKISGIIFANEVLDALPVHCFRMGEKNIEERSVELENNKFNWRLTKPTADLEKSVTTLQQEIEFPEGYESEINLALDPWIKNLSNCLQSGVILLFDYGYGRREFYHPDRTQGTLMCYYQHQRHTNPFLHVGLQDITAHVDFTAVIESAVSANLTLGGYTTQAAFLFAAGLLELAQSETLSDVEQFKQNQAIKTLTLPSQMGEAIKVIALTKNYDNPLKGFSLQTRIRDL